MLSVSRLSLALTLCLLAASAMAGLRCVECGDEISGKPRVSSTGVYCSLACEEAAIPRCAACGKGLRGEYLVLGKSFYCSRACAPAAGPELSCSRCAKAISGQYLKMGDAVYCSQDCVRSTLPRCFACAAPVERGLQVAERIYCETHGKAPTCGACGFPSVEPQRLPDGRVFCRSCSGATVTASGEAAEIYRRAADSVEAITGLKLGLLPPLELVSKTELLRQGEGLLNEASLGLYRANRMVTTVDGRATGSSVLSEPRISIVSHLGAGRFEAAAVHELTHHLMALHFAAAEDEGPAWMREGVAEYLSAISCLRAGREELAGEMRDKDPPYGNGLRWMQWRFGSDNWSGLRLWLSTVDARSLPSEPQR